MAVSFPSMEKRPLSLSSTPDSESPPGLKTTDLSEHHDGRDLQLERQAVRKLDYTILPILTLFNLVSFLDRSNIGNARVAGLQKDLHLTDRQYQICLTVFFVSYIAVELPTGLLLKKVGPRLLLSTVVITWGIVVTLEGFISSYAGLITVRVLLGLLEGPVFPSMVLYLSSFYTRKDLSLRIALFCSSVLAGAFSGLLAAAIENMNGIGGRPGWAWIFILEGLFSIFIGILGFFIIPSTPSDSKFLTDNQKYIIMSRLERDRPSIEPVDKFTFKTIMISCSSPHVIMVFIMFFLEGTTVYGLAYFLPSIVKQLGFSANKTQLLSVGPFVVGLLVTLTSAYLSDRYESRGKTVAIVSVLAVVGYGLYLGAEHKFTSYGALYLMVPGTYAATPVLAAWMSNNSEPYYRRGTSVAMGLIASTMGGILSNWSFPTNEGPKFRKTTVMNLIFSILLIIISLVNVAYLSWRNKVKKRPEERAKLLEKYMVANEQGKDEGKSRAWNELGDRHPDFVYTL